MVRKVSDILAEETKAGTQPTLAKPVRKVADIAAEESQSGEPGMLRKLAGGIGTAAAFMGRQVDRVSGAPLRAAITEVQDARDARGGRTEGLGKFLDPQEYVDIGRAGLGYIKNFGVDPDKVPSGREVMARQGFSDEGGAEVGTVSPELGYPNLTAPTQNGKGPSAAAMAGFALDAAAPIPGLGALKVAGKAGGGVARMVGSGAEMGAKAADAVTGTKVAGGTVKAAQSLGKSIKETTEGLKGMFNASQADDFGQAIETAQRNGIDLNNLPSSVEFGPSSVVSRSDRVKAEGPLGQPLLEKHQRGLEQVQDAIHRDIATVGGGAPRTRAEAGEVLREGFNEGVKRAFGDVEMSHNKILEANPKLRLSQDQIANLAPKLNEYEAWAKKKIELGSTNAAKEQGRQIQRAIDGIRKKGESYQGALDALREIGDTAFKSKNTLADIPPDVAKFRKLYGDLSDAMIGTVEETFDAATARSLRESNASMSKVFGDKSLLGEIGERHTAPEDLFKSIIEHGDSKRLAALKEYLTPEQLQALKGSFLNELIKVNSEGHFTFKSLHNALRQKKDVAMALFDPGEIDNFQHLINLGDKFGPAVMSTSGTGASNAFMDFFRTARDRGTDALITDPIKDKARAIGFNVEEFGGRSAAQHPGPGPIMSLSPGTAQAIGEGLGSLKIRSRSLRQFSNMGEDDK